MYILQNTKIGCFTYNNKVYQSNTKILYNGICICNQNAIIINNKIVSFMYYDGQYIYFKDDNSVYKCTLTDFNKNIVQIVSDENKAPPKTNNEIYWTDSMVSKTIWYILVMIVATLFHERIGIWIFSTIVWYLSTFKKK